jgi:hypothetical protein
MIPTMPSAAYVFCIVRSARKPNIARVPAGLPGGSRPKIVAARRQLWLALSEVPLDRYGGDRLEVALRDLDWVAEIAVAHEAVVEHFAGLRDTAVVPMKLFTMFSTEARAVEEMSSRRTEIDTVFGRIAGCEEWGVRIMRRAMPARTRDDRPRTGAAFLAARKQVRDDARSAVEKATNAAVAVYDLLLPLAQDVRRRSDSPTGATPPLLEASFLVKSRGRAKFRAAARRAARACDQAGAEMTLTGPWPAYNFVAERARGEST